jgi:multiple RNA-binding domain-containing protein 1
VRKPREEKKFMSDFQKKKEDKMKELAGEDFNWSTLFIRPDTVANAMAAQFNVEKGELFDRENTGSLGVRMALGETNIIADTKKFLEREGVSLDALQGVYNKNIERSTTTILIRNIPFSATIEELKNLFSRFGTMNKLVMPATKALALVDFAAAQEARAAFRGLAYKQFKGAPLYLEWAPIGIIDPKKAAAAAAAEATDEQDDKTASAQASAASADEDDDTDSDPSQVTLFVKNLAFGTSDNTFRSTIEGLLGPVRAITIARRRDNETGKTLSQGFGFVECTSRQQALDGYKKLAGITIDGHQLQVTFSSRGSGDVDASKNSKKRKRVSRTAPPSTTIMVRNIPFQASKKEVRELFAAFGELKSVRLPNKAGGQGHRGFAFIEFLTKDEAKQAMDAVENSRLYGRHLVLEFAKDGDENQDVDALREKTALLYKKTHPGPM